MSKHAPDPVEFMNELAARALGDTKDASFEVPTRAFAPVVTHLEMAGRHKDAGRRLQGSTRFRFLKNLVLRIARLHTSEQAAFNSAILAVLHALDYNANTLRIEEERRLPRLEAAATRADKLMRELTRQLDRLHERIVQLEADACELSQRQAAARSDITVQRARVDLFLQDARRSLPKPFDQADLEALTADTEAWLAPLYAQLEETFRGSREQIMELQEEYLPDILALGSDAPVVDIGCGRGEWLELLAANGVAAYGIDTNDMFVKRNTERGLDVRKGDGIEHLLSVEPGSVGAVTAFHVIEHLSFTDAVRLVDAALVALQPGGLLIFETPNPTNLKVGASTFYIDPTHRNPLHPSFLQFLVEARGFVEVEIRFVHPSTDLPLPLPDDPAARRPTEDLNWALFGPQDYAVVGRKVRHDA